MVMDAAPSNGSTEEQETKIIYHIDEGHEDTPYLIKLLISPNKVTLADFKNALNRPNFKFYFKSMDADFGVVKEELIDEDAILPSINGRVVSWLVPGDETPESPPETGTPTGERVGGIGDSRPPSFHANQNNFDGGDTSSTASSNRAPMALAPGYHKRPAVHRPPNRMPPRSQRRHRQYIDGGSSMMTSDLDTTSFFDSEDDSASRFTMTTETTSHASKYGKLRRRVRKHHRLPPMSRASSFSSITDSTMSLNVITVTLPMDAVNFLGISVVGQSNKNGEGGIYVGSIMKGGAVAQDGRVEPGDMILEVNGVSFENMSNDDAVRMLREAVQKPGPIHLVVAKCWESSPKGYFTIPRQEPVRPIDPSAWVAHTAAMRADFPGRPGLSAPSISGSSSLTSSMPETGYDEMPLSVNTDMAVVVRAMRMPDSGLEIRDRMWLKITIANAFIGSDLVDWLFNHLEGFSDRRDALIYARSLLKAGYIRHTVNKITFSQQCYYVFGDSPMTRKYYADDFSSLTLDDDPDSISQIDHDTLAPLPAPAWNNQFPFASSSNYIQQANSYQSMPYAYSNEAASYGTFQPQPPATSRHSGSEGSSGSETPGAADDKTHTTEIKDEAISHSTPTPVEQQRPLANVPRDISGSKQSFRMAMGNPCELFVDIM